MTESDKFKQMSDKYFSDEEPIDKEWEQTQFIKFLSEDIYRFQIMANHDSSFKHLTRNLGCFFCETPISTENVYFRCQNLKSLQYISMHRSCTLENAKKAVERVFEEMDGPLQQHFCKDVRGIMKEALTEEYLEKIKNGEVIDWSFTKGNKKQKYF